MDHHYLNWRDPETGEWSYDPEIPERVLWERIPRLNPDWLAYMKRAYTEAARRCAS